MNYYDPRADKEKMSVQGTTSGRIKDSPTLEEVERRCPPIEHSLNTLAHRCDSLESMVNRLAVRLEPVMRSSNPQAPGASGPDIPGESSLIRHIENFNMRLAQTLEALDSLCDRLEI